MKTAKNTCTICKKPSIPGLFKGAGKCQYHWNEGVWGKAWADNVESTERRREMNRNPNAKPQHQHDCPECNFVGSVGKYDLYYCLKSGLTEYVARCGNGSEYYSGWINQAMRTDDERRNTVIACACVIAGEI